MKTVKIDVRPLKDSLADFARVWKTGKPEPYARISFASHELLWKVLNAKRWELLKAMTGAGPMSLREAARRVKRDVKAVHTDVRLLLKSGVLDKTKDGKIVFPYDAIHVDFVLKAA